MHASVTKTIIGLDNGMSPVRRQTITWTNVDLLSIGPLGTNINGILINIETFLLRKMRLWNTICEMAAIFSRLHWINVTLVLLSFLRVYIQLGKTAMIYHIQKYLLWVEAFAIILGCTIIHGYSICIILELKVSVDASSSHIHHHDEGYIIIIHIIVWNYWITYPHHMSWCWVSLAYDKIPQSTIPSCALVSVMLNAEAP